MSTKSDRRQLILTIFLQRIEPRRKISLAHPFFAQIMGIKTIAVKSKIPRMVALLIAG
jgi:hypothetical protein